MTNRDKHFLTNTVTRFILQSGCGLLIAIIPASIVFYIANWLTYAEGFPIKYHYQTVNCIAYDPVLGCPFVYNTTLIVTDFLFWLFLTLGIIYSIDKFWSHRQNGNSQPIITSYRSFKISSAIDTLFLSIAYLGIGAITTLSTARVYLRSGFIGPYGWDEYGLPFAWRYEGTPFIDYRFALPVDILFWSALSFIIIIVAQRRFGPVVEKHREYFLSAIIYVAGILSMAIFYYSHPAPMLP
jgi:hypothetical protein